MNARKMTVQPHVIPERYPRKLKIYSALMLKGKWLKEAGFNPGNEVKIIVEDNRLVIERSLP